MYADRQAKPTRNVCLLELCVSWACVRTFRIRAGCPVLFWQIENSCHAPHRMSPRQQTNWQDWFCLTHTRPFSILQSRLIQLTNSRKWKNKVTPTYLPTLNNAEQVNDWILTTGNCTGHSGHHRERKNDKLQQQKRRLEKSEHRVRAGTTKQCTCSYKAFPSQLRTSIPQLHGKSWSAGEPFYKTAQTSQ